MAARIFSVRLNLDDFNAGLAACEGDAERLAFIAGLQVGFMGGERRDGWPPAKSSGWRVGEASRQHALDRQAAKSDAGKASAESRQRSNGTAQPGRTHPEQCSSGVQAQPERCPNLSTNPLIEESKDREIEKSTDPVRAGVDPGDVFATTLDPAIPVDLELRFPYEMREPWALAIRDVVGSKLARTNWSNWKRLTEEYGAQAVAKAAKTVPATDRWPDQVEVACEAARKRQAAAKSQARPAGPDPEKIARAEEEAEAQAVELLADFDAQGHAETKSTHSLRAALAARRGIGFALARVRMERPDLPPPAAKANQ